MNLQKLQGLLREHETKVVEKDHQDARRISVGIIHEGKMLGIKQVDLATYTDPGEVNNVVWLITGEY